MNTLNTDQQDLQSLGERQTLSLPIELEEGAPPVFFRSAMAVLTGLVALLLVWANIAQVREVSMAPGAIAPSIPARTVAHLEGGIIASVSVKPGDQVKIGDEILRLRRESADDSFARQTARRADLQIRAERLAAQAEARDPDFIRFRKDWPTLVEENEKLYQTSISEHAAAIEALSAREASARAELKAARKAEQSAKEQLGFAREQLGIQNQLIEGGFTSKQALLEANSNLASAKSAYADMAARLEQAERGVGAAVSEIERANAEYRNIASEQRTKATAELIELEESLLVSRDRKKRLTMRAPIAGIVNELSVHGMGDVIRPGETVASIVPTRASMIAEARLLPKDIGHIKLGQEAEITFTTFDPKKFGVLKGVISHISADSLIDERTGEAYYEVDVELVALTDKEKQLLEMASPGMELSVRIITHSRSLMTYLLKPVVRSVEGAFGER